jgi:DNA-binding NarL/FixJ family response regulator
VPRASIEVGLATVAGGLAETRTTVALIAEEGPRESVAEILQEQGVSYTAFDEVEDLFEQPADDGPSLVLLWIEDTISSPAGLIEPLRRRIERAPVVAGAAGVVLEGEMACALGPCLQAVQAGQICVPRQHWRQIEPPALSSREKQILGLVVMGYMNSQIAERLFLAESTIKSHLSSAFGKLGVRSRHEAVDLILDSERGLGMGILALGGEPLERTPTVAR